MTGKDRGTKAKVLKVIAGEDKILVEGVNEHKKHEKPKKAGAKGAVVTRIAPVHASNAMVWCASCGKGVRVGKKMIDGKNVRICKKCGVELDK